VLSNMLVLFVNLCCYVSARPDRFYYRTVHVGQTVKFPCETNLREDVNWKRMDTWRYIYIHGKIARPSAPRITVDKNSSYTLTIRNVTAEDAASYRCAEDGGHGSKRFYGLTVTGYTCSYTLFLILCISLKHYYTFPLVDLCVV